MGSVYAHALRGTLTADNLTNDEVNYVHPKSNLTPLGAAVWNGHIDQAELLLNRGADPNGAPRSRPPLYVAASRGRNAGRMIQMLLKYGADANLRSQIDGNSTPLLRAVVTGQPADIISFLVDKGASTTIENDKGESPEIVAQGKNDLALQHALRPRPQRDSSWLQALLVFTGLMLFIVAWANENRVIKATAVGGGAACVIGEIKKRFNMSGVFDPIIPVGLQEHKPEDKFENDVREYIKAANLDRFFPPGDPFLETVVAKAIRLDDNPENNLDVKDLTRLSLYQPVLYCDDSRSMQTGRRKDHQNQLVQRIASITTKLVPDDDGIELRFINHSNLDPDLSKPGLLTIDAIMTKVKFDGSTKIGTNLRNKVLQKFVYEPLVQGTLKRPVLISIITDGEPMGEDKNELKNAILECGKALENDGYDRKVVRFQLSQIGQDKGAKEFLSDLSAEPALSDVLFCTAELLDDKYEELRTNERRLEQWLLKLLMGPIMDAEEY